jgi:hypothetical protein
MDNSLSELEDLAIELDIDIQVLDDTYRQICQINHAGRDNLHVLEDNYEHQRIRLGLRIELLKVRAQLWKNRFGK